MKYSKSENSKAQLIDNKPDNKLDNKHKKKNKILSVVTGVIILMLALTAFLGNYMTEYAIGRRGDGANRKAALEVAVNEDQSDTDRKIAENTAKQVELTEHFIQQVENDGRLQTVNIQSADNLELTGFYYQNDQNEDSHDWAIVIHGYRSSHHGMTDYAQHYYDAGYQVLAPDLRACADSEGDYTGMGWLDRQDILRWIDWIIAQDPQADIVLHGVSMGAATTMMTSGEETPEQVKVFIEDCGYTSVQDIFGSELKVRFKLPRFPVLYSASLFARHKAGYGFAEASALEQVRKCDKPMFFVHGTADDFVPFWMERVLYEAKPGDNKELVEVQGAGHGLSMYLMGEEYWDHVFSFIDRYK